MTLKLLRIFVYVVLRLPYDLHVLFVVGIAIIIFLPIALYYWASGDRPEKNTEFDNKNIPFYATIKTVRQIWRN